MKKISETEEYEMYRIISEALLVLCELKPNDPVEFVVRKMLEMIGEEPSQYITNKKVYILHNIENY